MSDLKVGALCGAALTGVTFLVLIGVFGGNTSDWILLLVGIPVGIAASFLAWYLLFHWFTPSIVFSAQLSKQPDSAASGFSYRIKVRNTGTRTAIDLLYVVRWRVKGLGDRIENWNVVDLATSSDQSPFVEGQHHKIIRISPEDTARFPDPLFGANINHRARSKTLLLEDLFSTGTHSQIQAYVFACDAFSGTRRLFKSKWYGLDDIVEADFSDIPMSDVSTIV
ncbi:MAG: hypothetical protein K0U93_13670 [Gammaproteobacteria bacterium]|nr:hypothetical protein [Gammaproteobacteria bacterium]